MSAEGQSVERSISIQASMQTVWGIVSEPGWWVNSGTLVEHQIDDQGDGTQVVHDPDHGEFTVTTVRLDPPRTAAFRWHPRDPSEPATLIEFFLEDGPAGTVTLRVVESGFDTLTGEDLDAFVHDNTKGWDIELAAVRAAAEQG